MISNLLSLRKAICINVGHLCVMVFFFMSSDGYVVYMGADKYENEDLIRYGLPEDIWLVCRK
jgi:hypothetical protein